MSMSKREGETQTDLWIPTTELARSPGHPFYERLNKILSKAFREILAFAVDRKLDLRTASLWRGIERVANAKRLRGIFP